MSLVSLTLPSDGTTADVSDVNVPFNQLANVINGNIDNTNISSVSGSKIQTGTTPGTALDAQTQSGWFNTNQTFTYTGNNGNKEYTGTFPADMTSILSPGTKLKMSRSTTPPTQCMTFAKSSSQYATKASPAGLSFTTAYTCEAFIYMNSSPTTNQGIISRYDGTNGFLLWLDNTGRVNLSAGSATIQTSQQSLTIMRWHHIAATFSSGTFNIYINGALVPSSKQGSATTVTQAGSLQLGALNSAAYFDGYISEARIWSVAQSQSAIQSNMNISLTGSEANLVALFQGNGNFNDKTTNANNLTATNGAIATQASNPMNSVEYAIVTKVGAYSGGVTPITLFTGTDYNIPNQVLNNAQYSTQRTPQGFPASSGRWAVTMIINSSQDKNSGLARYVLQNPNGVSLLAPTGAWKVKSQITGLMTSSVAQAFNNVLVGVSTSNTIDTTNNYPLSKLFALSAGTPSNIEWDAPTMSIEDTLEFSSQTNLYMLVGSGSPNISLIRIAAGSSLTLECAYL